MTTVTSTQPSRSTKFVSSFIKRPWFMEEDQRAYRVHVACHEAAHAIFDLYTPGITFKDVVIRDDNSGLCQSNVSESVPIAERMGAHLAGPQAARALGLLYPELWLDEEHSARMSEGDERALLREISHHEGKEYFAWRAYRHTPAAYTAVQKIVRCRWPEIEALAALLLEKGHVVAGDLNGYKYPLLLKRCEEELSKNPQYTAPMFTPKPKPPTARAVPLTLTRTTAPKSKSSWTPIPLRKNWRATPLTKTQLSELWRTGKLSA